MTYTKKNPKFIEKIKSAKDNHKVPIVKKKTKTIFNIKKILKQNDKLSKINNSNNII